MSEYNKQKLAEANKGNKYNLGRIQSQETINKRMDTLRRIGHFEKLAANRIGANLSEEVKERIRRTCKKNGCGKWMKGRKLSDETRFKMSARTGENAANWRGGIYPLNLRIRKLYKYRQWRSDVFTRDDFTCVLCGKRGGNLEVDHIKSYSLIMHENKITSIDQARLCEELWNINNGRTLCIPCHLNTDTYGGNSRKIKIEVA